MPRRKVRLHAAKAILVVAGLTLLAGCGGGDKSDGASRPAAPATTTATPTTPQEAVTLMRSASDRLARVSSVAQAQQCERKAEVERSRVKTRADARALQRFAKRDGRAEIRRLMRASTDALEKGISAANSFLATCN